MKKADRGDFPALLIDNGGIQADGNPLPAFGKHVHMVGFQFSPAAEFMLPMRKMQATSLRELKIEDLWYDPQITQINAD